MSTRRRLLAMSAFGAVVIFVVVVLTVGFPSLGDDGSDSSSASALEPCRQDPRSVVLPFGVESTAGRWDSAPPLPISQDELRADTIGDLVYVGSGLREGSSDLVSTNAFFVFDPQRSTYRKLPPLPRRVDHPGFVAAVGDLYVIGGYYDWVPTADVFGYSPRTGAWTQLAPMTVPRGSPAAAAVGGRIVVAGGGVGDRGRTPSGVVEILDLATGRWSRGPDLPTPRHHAGAAAVGDTVVVAGGRDSNDLSLDVVERLDVTAGQWTEAPPLPLGVGGLALVTAGGRFVAIGGGDDDEAWVTPATWSLDPSTDSWKRLGDLRTPRHGHAAAAVGKDVFVFGGAPCPSYGHTSSAERLSGS